MFVLASALACALAVAGGRAVHAPALSAVFVGFFAGGAAFAALLEAPATPKRVALKIVQLDRFTARPRWTAVALLAIVGGALLVRLWHFNDVGYNSDEAVYAGQGAGIAHDPQLAPYFPVFRAHPLLFQSVVAIGYELHQGDWFGRAAAIAFGALCVLATFELGRLLYGVRAGLIAAAVLALMPYHVIVSRQVLLDGPQAFFTDRHALPPDPLRPLGPDGVALLRRGGHGSLGAREGAERDLLRRRLRVLRALARDPHRACGRS